MEVSYHLHESQLRQSRLDRGSFSKHEQGQFPPSHSLHPPTTPNSLHQYASLTATSHDLSSPLHPLPQCPVANNA
jgi:hypothetical protein